MPIERLIREHKQFYRFLKPIKQAKYFELFKSF